MAEDIQQQPEQEFPLGIMDEFKVSMPEKTADVVAEQPQVTPEVNSTEKISSEPQKTGSVTTEPTPDWFDVKKINERFGTEFQTEDEIKETIGSLKAHQEYLDKKDYYTTLEESMSNLVDTFNPLKRLEAKKPTKRSS